jgi:hypothetical protein
MKSWVNVPFFQESPVGNFWLRARRNKKPDATFARDRSFFLETARVNSGPAFIRPAQAGSAVKLSFSAVFSLKYKKIAAPLGAAVIATLNHMRMIIPTSRRGGMG